MQPSPTRPERPLGVPVITRAATAVASRPRTSVAVLAAAFLLLGLALASGAGAAVYWSNSTAAAIGSANNDGTAVNQAFIGVSRPRGVASDGAHLYWTNGADRSIGRANLDGTGVNPTFITGVDTSAVAVDAAHVYWDTRDGSIGRANLDGTGVNQTFIPQVGAVFGVAVDRTHVYWSTFGSIGRANLDGTGANQNFILFDPLLDQPCGVAVDAGHLYWANALGTIGRANLDGTGANPNFVQAGQAGEDLTCGVAVDSAHLYWARGALNPPDTGDGIGRANLDGTGANRTFITTPQPLGVAVDAAIQTAQPSRISLDDVIEKEGDDGQTGFDFTVSLDAPQPAPVTVDFTTADGTATAPSDYAASSGTLTFAPGETAKTVTVQVNGDTTVEPNEAFTLNLSNATGNAAIADSQGFGTIVNDDQAPSAIKVDDLSLAEGDAGQTAFQFTVSLGTPQPARVTVDFATADATASAPDDFAATNGTLTFAAGETAKTVTVQVNGDTAVEPNEAFTLNLANANGNATIADAQGIGTIANDDQVATPPPSRISINDVTTGEGNAGQTAFRFTASLDAPQPAPVTVDFTTGNGTAIAPGDYAAASGTLTFAPGEAAKTVTVQVNGDTTVEPDETFNLNLSNATGNATIADAQGVGTIVDDDQVVIVPPSRISIGDVTMTEGNAGQTAFQFTVSLDTPQPGPVTVDFATADGTATAPSDYAAASGTLTFAPGETVKTVTVQVDGDTTVEPNDTFTVNLANATGNATIADAQGVGTIVNDDQPVIVPPSRISVNDVTMAEGNAGQTAFRFTVSLDAAQSAPVTVDFATADGTATAPKDYAATSGTLTFAPGETAKTVTVQVNGDTSKEPNETFNLNLAKATGNAAIADGHAVGTIINDDRKHGHNITLACVLPNHRAVTRRLAAAVPLTGSPAFGKRGTEKSY